MSKKSQITIFIILSFVVLVTFSLLYSIKQQSVTKKLEKDVTAVSIDQLNMQEIQGYVQTCVDKNFAEGLELITKQGGNIFDYQDGSLLTDKIPYIAYHGVNVSYQIFRPKFYPQDTLAGPSLYPCYTSDPLCKMGKAMNKSNIYCCDKNPSLWICKWSGDYCFYNYNHTQTEHFNLGIKGKASLCTSTYSIGGYLCVCPYGSCGTSIEAQLNHYVDSKIVSCLNFSMFKAYNITLGIISSNITIGNDDVSLDINLPLTINIIGYAPTRKEISFKSKQPARLLQLFSFIFGMGSTKGLIDYEMSNITYDVIKNGQELANKYGYFTIQKIVLPDNKTSIIIVNDTSDSKINGKNIFFQFAIQNRNPALDYLSKNPLGAYDIFVPKGQEIILRPDAYDPDEDNLLYTYHGWKTNSPGPDMLTSEANSPINYWELSNYYTDKTNCVVNANKGMQEHVCANNITTDADVGTHYVTIEVTDPYGYRDWQTLKILVGNPLEPRIEEDTTNPNHKACKQANGGFVSYAAISGKPFYLEGYCGGPIGKYTFIWSFDTTPVNPPSSTVVHPVSNGCTDPLSLVLSSDTEVSLTIQDPDTGNEKSASSRIIHVYPDNDNDGYCSGSIDVQYQDCDDTIDTGTNVYPGAPELCDGKDNNCDGLVDEPDNLVLESCPLCPAQNHVPSDCVAGHWIDCTCI